MAHGLRVQSFVAKKAWLSQAFTARKQKSTVAGAVHAGAPLTVSVLFRLYGSLEKAPPTYRLGLPFSAYYLSFCCCDKIPRPSLLIDSIWSWDSRRVRVHHSGVAQQYKAGTVGQMGD